MAVSLMENVVEISSNENSVSTKEFLHIEKSCEGYKDSDEEIKLIFNEINKLSGTNPINNENADLDDVDLILKKAEDLAIETKNILSSPVAIKNNVVPNVPINRPETVSVPVIRVTKPKDSETGIAVLKNGEVAKVG